MLMLLNAVVISTVHSEDSHGRPVFNNSNSKTQAERVSLIYKCLMNNKMMAVKPLITHIPVSALIQFDWKKVQFVLESSP